jgi:ABC-type nitrate/sulfonate/bicarbonate transport system substrate-binding protein
MAVGRFAPVAYAAPRRVNVFMGTTPDFGNIWVAQLKGFFGDENIEANIRLFPSGTAATDAFRAGVAEFVGCGDIPSARLWETMGTRYIAPVCYDSYTSVLMVKSAIQTGDQLRGKTLATRLGSSMELMVEQTFQKFGLPSGAAKVINMEPADMVITLDKGDIDGFFWVAPFEERAKQVSGDRVRVLLRGQDVGFISANTLNTRAEVIRDDSPMVQSFVRGLAKASDWVMSNKGEASEIIAKALKLDPAIARVTEKMDFATRFDQRVHPYYCNLGKFMFTKGLIKKPLDWDSFQNLDYLRNVDPSRAVKIVCG